MYRLTFDPRGRLGNSIFRYMAMILVALKFKNAVIDIDARKKIGAAVSNSRLIELLSAEEDMLCSDLCFTDFYQVGDIYQANIAGIKQYILENQNVKLYSNDDPSVLYTYETKYIYGPSAMKTKVYDFVLHLRLEDVACRDRYMCIKVEKFVALLNTIPHTELSGRNAIVVHYTHTDFENNYIKTITDWFSENNISVTLEDNDIYTDFGILSNCKVLVCSMSTMSWAAAMLSDVLEKCYFPDYQNNPSNQTFKNPIKNTVLFPI